MKCNRTLGTVRTPAFFLSENRGPDDLQNGRRAVDACTFAAHTILAPDDDRPGQRVIECDGLRIRVPEGWTFVGIADVTLRMLDESALVAEKVQALEASSTQIMAEAQARVTEIRRQINTLLAIEHNPTGGA
jgi:hypothetical protein